MERTEVKLKQKKKGIKGITLIALVVTIQVNCCKAAMERKFKKILKKEKNSCIIYDYVT